MKTFACVVESINSAYEKSLIINADSEEDAKNQIQKYLNYSPVVYKSTLKELKFLETKHPGIYPIGTHSSGGERDSLDD